MSSTTIKQTYKTKAGTRYVLSDKGDLRNNQRIGRTVYISPKEADSLIKNKIKKTGDRIDRDSFFNRAPYNGLGGRILYEELNTHLRLSSVVTEISPLKSGADTNFEEIVFEEVKKNN